MKLKYKLLTKGKFKQISLKVLLKTVKVFDDLSGKGSSFHSLGPAAEKALSLYVFRVVLEMLKSLCEAERISKRELAQWCKSSEI